MSAGKNDGRVRGQERVGRHDHLVARSEPDSHQRNQQRAGAGARQQRVIDAAEPGELLLEGIRLVQKLRIVEAAVTKQVARIEHFEDFLLLFFANPIGTGARHQTSLLSQNRDWWSQHV
jgi:hypothetical protein